MAVERGEIIEIDSERRHPTCAAPTFGGYSTLREAREGHSDADTSLELMRQLRKFRGAMRPEELQNAN